MFTIYREYSFLILVGWKVFVICQLECLKVFNATYVHFTIQVIPRDDHYLVANFTHVILSLIYGSYFQWCTKCRNFPDVKFCSDIISSRLFTEACKVPSTRMMVLEVGWFASACISELVDKACSYGCTLEIGMSMQLAFNTSSGVWRKI